MKYVYAILCLLGIVLPYCAFIPWLGEHGFNLTLLVEQAMGSSISAFAWLDVLISAIALIGFILVEAKRLRMARAFIPILGTCLVGVSFGLPLFLLMRERHLERTAAHA